MFGSSFDHVEQPGGAGLGPDSGQVDDHGDVLVAAPGVAPDVLVDPDGSDPVEAVWIVDQDALALSQDRVVRGVPRHGEAFGDPGHGQVLDHDRFQRPPQPPPRQLSPRLGRPRRVLAPHVPAVGAPVAPDRDQQNGGSPSERLVRQPSGHGVARRAFAATAMAPLVWFKDPAGQHRPVRLETLAGDEQTEFVESAEGGQIRDGEHVSAVADGSVGHVEVFQDDRVGAFILGRPRRLSRAPPRQPDLHPQL